jgi:predicted ATP-grasp superfamily ATP-dependent carboligase
MRYHLTGLKDIGLRFVWGNDFIRRSQGPWTIEVNPRYTAGMEVLEYASGVAILTEHWEELPELQTCVGKGIYYAPLDFTFPASGPWDDSLANCTDVWVCHDYADIPHAGSRIEKGQPVITIFAQGDTEADCLQLLQRRAAELDRLFGAPTPGELP